MDIWTAHDLARELGYAGATPEFWKWCEKVGLHPINGKPFAFLKEDVENVRS